MQKVSIPKCAATVTVPVLLGLDLADIPSELERAYAEKGETTRDAVVSAMARYLRKHELFPAAVVLDDGQYADLVGPDKVFALELQPYALTAGTGDAVRIFLHDQDGVLQQGAKDDATSSIMVHVAMGCLVAYRYESCDATFAVEFIKGGLAQLDDIISRWARLGVAL